MHWYNPMTRTVEDVAAPSTDEEAMEMLSGASDSRALAEKYIELRREGMGAERTTIFVGHHWRMWHLRYQPVG
jgi:hypothetical protein